MRLRVAILCSCVAAASSACAAWCGHPCSELNGDVSQECGDCVAPTECRPGNGFPPPAPTTVHDDAEAAAAAAEAATAATAVSATPIVSDATRNGKTLRYERKLGGFNQPAYVLPMRDGRLMVSEAAFGQGPGGGLQLISSDGSSISRWPEFKAAAGIAAADADSFFLGNQRGYGLHKVSQKDGSILATIGSMRSGAQIASGGIDSALGVVVGGDNDIVFVADVAAYQVTAFDAALKSHLFTITQDAIGAETREQVGCTPKVWSQNRGFQGAGCFNPHGLAWTPAHGLFVTDADSGVRQRASSRRALETNGRSSLCTRVLVSLTA